MSNVRRPKLHEITLLAAKSEDSDFAFQVTEAAMRVYVEKSWGAWEPFLQRGNHDRSFKAKTHQVIFMAGERAGILETEDPSTHVQLEKLYLLPRFQGVGVGSQVLHSVLKSANAVAKPVCLRVLAVNVSAQRFYERHGSVITSRTPERVFMRAGA